MGGVRSSARSGLAVLATPASCLLRSTHALREPEYRLGLRVGSVSTPRVIMQAVFPCRQGTPCGDLIASVKLSQPERLRILARSLPVNLGTSKSTRGSRR